MNRISSEWADLLARRPTFRDALGPLGRVIEAWDSWPGSGLAPLVCSAEDARRRWSTGEPLLGAGGPEGPPLRIGREPIEPLLHAALDVLDPIEDTRAFAESWDRGEIAPNDLLPTAGRLGSVRLQERCRLTQDAVGFLAVAGLRPLLTAHFAACRPLVSATDWEETRCPCCGAPPGFSELLEDGRRQLACHLCDTRWTFPRLMCPLCGSRVNDDFVRLIAEDADEGYAITACKGCRGYVKEIDRRARWNAGSALVEDWGSPHLDLIAHRQQYWRPVPTLIQLTAPSTQ